MCVYKSRLAPHNLAHEPTPKKSGEFEERFALMTTSGMFGSVRSDEECVCGCMLPSLKSPISYIISLYAKKPAVWENCLEDLKFRKFVGEIQVVS